MINFILRYKNEIQNAQNHLQAESQLLNTSAGEVEVALLGNGSPILISHGSGGGYDMGLWLGELIGGQYQYVAPSRFGYLRSPVPTNSNPESQADTYAALLDALNITKVIMIGLSGGGASALQFALRHSGRCKGLIMISAISQPIPPLPRSLRMIYPLMLKSDFLPWLIYLLSPQTVYQGNGVSRELLLQIKQDPEKMEYLHKLYKTTFPSTSRRDGMINDLNLMENFTPYPIEQINTPTLVIHAMNDPIIPITSGEFTASTIPNAQFLKLEEGGHFVCVTHLERTIPIIRGFLGQYAV